MPSPDAVRGEWWEQAKFGLMLHWGVYSHLGGVWQGRTIPGLGEWIRWHGNISSEDYSRVAAAWNPTELDVDAWVRAAQDAGARWVVLTAKHHDGFALFRSRADQFNSVHHAALGRDVVEELANACARRGMRMGLYYSHAVDWNDPDAAQHWDDPGAPQRDFEAYFRRKALPQIEELMTQYGEIAVLWPDLPFLIQPAQCEEILAVVRRHQPECLVGGRLGWSTPGDFASMGDNEVPELTPHGRWETAATLNDTWGFRHDDHAWKSPREVLELLTQVVSKGGNLLLNVGPDGEGRVPGAALASLEGVGAWLSQHGEAVYGTCPSPFADDLPQGPMTTRGTRAFLFLQDDPDSGPAELGGLPAPLAAERVDADPLPYQRFEFANPPVADPVSQPQGHGVIRLSAARGRVAGDLRTHGSGLVSGGPGELTWTFRCPGGRYRVWLDSVCAMHRENGGAWTGGTRVAWDDHPDLFLTADCRPVSARSRYYEEAQSDLGVVELPEGLITRTLDVLDPLADPLRAVRLEPEPPGDDSSPSLRARI